MPYTIRSDESDPSRYIAQADTRFAVARLGEYLADDLGWDELYSDISAHDSAIHQVMLNASVLILHSLEGIEVSSVGLASFANHVRGHFASDDLTDPRVCLAYRRAMGVYGFVHLIRPSEIDNTHDDAIMKLTGARLFESQALREPGTTHPDPVLVSELITAAVWIITSLATHAGDGVSVALDEVISAILDGCDRAYASLGHHGDTGGE